MRTSESMEYQLPMPRPPMLRVPMAFTSSSLPGLMWGSRFSPGDGRVSFLAEAASLAAFSSSGVAVGEPGTGLEVPGGVGVGAGDDVGEVWPGMVVGDCAQEATERERMAARLSRVAGRIGSLLRGAASPGRKTGAANAALHSVRRSMRFFVVVWEWAE